MDDLLPWEISADTPAVEAAATGSAPPRREVAVSFSEHTATDHDALAGAQPDGLDWLGDLANNAAPSKPAPIMMATRLAAVTETAIPTPDEDADPGDLDVNAQPMSFPSANAPATAPHEADVPRAPPSPPSTGVREVTREHPKDGPLTQDETLPTPPTASVTARDIRSELDADTTTISASHAPHTQEPRGAAPPPANGAPSLPLTPLPTVLQSVPDREHDASDQAESTHSTSGAPPAVAVAVAAATSSSPTTPPPAPPIATTASSSSSAAHAHTRARQSNRSSATPSTIVPAATTASSQTRQRASKATEGGRAGSLRPVVREPSQSLVKTTGKSRMSTRTSHQSRSNSKADQQQQQRSSSTRQAAAASSKAAGPTYNRENFFFAGDDVGIEFGTGTTGLYASKATPVVAIDKSRSVTTRPGEKGPRNTTTTVTGTANRVQAEEANTFAATAPAGDHHHSHNNNNNSSSGPCEATDGARAYFMSAFYTKVPQGYHESQWARKEEAFGDWRTTQLKHSTYYTYGRGGGKAGTTNTGANKTSAGGTPEALCAEAGGDPWLDPVSFYTAEEAYAFECRRTAAIAAERRAKIKARDSQTADLEAKLSEQRRDYQRGVPTYLPDAYFRTTLEQERVTQLPGNHLTCSDPAAVITPRDHHKAQVAYRHYQDQVADDRVTLRQRDARKYHARIEKDIAQSRRELEAFKDAWLDGVPHVSRDDAFAKTRAAEENQRAQARVNAEESAFNRGVYALYRDEEEAQRREHLTYLRTKLPEASQSRLRELREKSARQAAEREEAAAAQRAQEKARALQQQQQQRSKSTLSPTPPPHSTKPVTTTTTTTTTATSAPAAAPSPVPIALPAARSFVSEVRQWQETFQTPNVAPPNAQDAEYRREWLRRLSGDRRGFKKETVELGKEQPGRVQQAVVDLLDQRAKTADGQRKENASLKERRLEVEAQNYAYATGMYERNKDLLAKGRSARQEVAAERQMSATAQRHREKEVDALMSALDEEEMKRLKEAVMSTRS